MKRKIISLLLALVAVSATGQTLTQRRTVATLAMGGIKLEQIVQKQDTIYAMLIRTGNRYHNYVSVDLGNKQNAIRLLNVLNDVQLKGDDMLSLENVTDNVVTRGTFGSLRFYSQGRQFSGDCHKMYIRKLIEVLEGQPAEAEETADPDGD